MGKTRRTGTKNPAVMAQAKDAIQKFAGTAEVQFRQDLPQQEKISHALQTLLKMAVPEGSPLSTFRIALDLIVLTWNVSLHAPEHQAPMLRDVVEKLTKSDPAMRRETLSDFEILIIRKQLFFPDDKRMVVSWEVKLNGPTMLVSAAAVMAAPDAGD